MKNRESHGVEFKRILEGSDFTKSELGRRISVTPQTIYHWETRGVPPKYAYKVAALLECSASAISAVEDEPEVFGAHFERLILAPMMDETGETRADLLVDASMFRQGADISVSALEVMSSAMAPEIERGDMVYFDASRPPRPGELCIARSPSGEVMVRRYREVDAEGTYTLVAASPDWPDITTSIQADDYELIGSVLFVATLSKLPAEYRSR